MLSKKINFVILLTAMRAICENRINYKFSNICKKYGGMRLPVRRRLSTGKTTAILPAVASTRRQQNVCRAGATMPCGLDWAFLKPVFAALTVVGVCNWHV